MVIGYTTGVFDLFHVGHVNMLRNAKSLCDKLIVGVTIDELVKYKSKSAVISFTDRIEVVRACRYVDIAVPQINMNKMDAYNSYRFDIMFVGDDWKGSEKWNIYNEEFNNVNVKILYLPYTKNISSTLINQTLETLRNEGSTK
jgi:glycerol-3-phosphate cytidylyltransferase